MSDLSQVLKAGTVLIIETGKYSDHSWHGPVRVLRDCTKQELADRYKVEWKKDEPNPSDFLPWLIKTGHVEDIDNVEAWHVGSYGEFEP